MTILVLIGMLFMIIWEMFHGRIKFKLSASAAASEFCEWVQVEIDYISHTESGQALLISMVACAAAIVHRNHFFCPHQKHKSSESKVKFGQGG